MRDIERVGYTTQGSKCARFDLNAVKDEYGECKCTRADAFHNRKLSKKIWPTCPMKTMDAKTPRAASVPSQSLGRNIELRLNGSNT